ITARVVGTDIRIVHSTGADLNFTGSVTSQGSLTITPAQYDPQTQEYVPQAAGSENLVLDNTSVVVVGGTAEMTLEEGYSLRAATVAADGVPVDQAVQTGSIFGDLQVPDALEGIPFETNQSDPKNPDTYYRATSIAISAT